MNFTVLLVLAAHAIPFIITQYLWCRQPIKGSLSAKVRFVLAGLLNLAVNGGCFGAVWLAVFHRATVNRVKTLLRGGCSYQVLARFGLALLAVCVASAFWGLAGYWLGHRALPVFTHKQKSRLLAVAVVFTVPFAVLTGALSQSLHCLQITAFCRKTVGGVEYVSSGGDSADADVGYLELVNTGTLPYSLKKLTVTDNPERTDGIPLPDRELQPGEVFRCYIEEQDRLDFSGKGGDTVYLIDSGTKMGSLQLPALERDDRYVLTDGVWQLVSGQKVYVEKPAFSASGGFYDRAFDLTLTAPPGTRVYYTLDCSDPGGDATEYTGPIRVYDKSGEQNRFVSLQTLREDYLRKPNPNTQPVDKCFVVRAVAVDADGNCSDIVTQSYFIGLDQYKDKNVLSLVSDPEGLFGAENGICVTGSAYDEQYLRIIEQTPEGQEPDIRHVAIKNYNQHGMAWERETDFELFENGVSQLRQAVGLRVAGNASRAHLISKRFSVYARKLYSGDNRFAISGINGGQQHSLLLRNGNMHAFCQLTAADRAVETADFIKTAVFVDGEYWNTDYLYAKMKPVNIALKYGLNEDIIGFVKNQEPNDLAETGDRPYSAIFDYPQQHDLSQDSCYREYGNIIDIQSYTDLTCLRSFLCDTDYSDQNNVIAWHTVRSVGEGVADGRWRFGLYDADCPWSEAERVSGLNAYEIDPFTVAQPFNGLTVKDLPIFSALRQNEQFCQQFVLTYTDLVNTVFSPENVAERMRQLNWTDEKVTTFFDRRAEYMNTFVAREFGLTGSLQSVTLTADGPAEGVTLNTVTPDLSTEWTGAYFTDYPVTLTANGAGFDHWEITAGGNTTISNRTTVSVPVTEGGVCIHAVFR